MDSRAILADAPKWVLFLLAVIIIGNVAGLFLVGAHTDETYYWVWSRRLDLGYYDHPPLVAWMVRLFSEVLGQGLAGLRAPAVLAWGVSAFVVFQLTRKCFGHPAAGWLAVLILTSLPIFQVGFHIVGPDSPLMLFTSLTYYYVSRAISEDRTRYWLFAGAAVGFALLGKYTAILLPGVIFFALLVHPANRRLLARPVPWLALVLAAVVFSPVVIWNAQNDWISFAYQWGHGTATDSGFSVYKLLDYLAQQMSAVSPWVFVAMAVATFRPGRFLSVASDRLQPLLVTGFWLPLVFFGITGSMSTSMHNWPVIAYVPGSVMLGGLLASLLYRQSKTATPEEQRTGIKIALIALVTLAIVIVDLARFPQWTRLLDNPKKLAGSSVIAVWGWDTLANSILDVQRERGLPANCGLLFVGKYNDAGLGYYHAAGEMAFHLKNEKRVLLEPVPHFKQYNHWPDKTAATAASVCMVIAGPANQVQFDQDIQVSGIGQVKLGKVVTIVYPDTTRSRYAIYIK